MKTVSYENKYQHLGRVYQLIEQFELISRTDLAKLSGYAPASITNLTKKLIDHKLVLERTSQNLPGRGRPAIGLSLSPFHWHCLCITLSMTEIVVSLCNLSGQAVYQQYYPLLDDKKTALADNVIANIKQFFAYYSVDLSCVIAASVSVIGKLNRTKSKVVQPGDLQVEEELLSPLAQLLNKPIYLNEHFQLWLLAESTFGRLISQDDVIFLQLDEAINLSVLLRGELLYRDEHKRMNVDKMWMPQFSHLSELVSQNIAETERYQLANQITFSALAKLIDHYFPNKLTTNSQKIALLCQSIQQNNPQALAILAHITDNLAYMLLNLVHLFSTEKIMICSPLLTIQPLLFSQIQQKLTENLRQTELNIDLVTSQYAWNSPLIPAAAIKYEIYTGNLIQSIIKW